MNEFVLLVAIDDAVSTILPAVLSDLICQYAVVRSYEFRSDGIPNVSKYLVCHLICGKSKSQVVEDVGRYFSTDTSTYHRLVSNIDISAGGRTWTIQTAYEDRVWIGVTTLTANDCGPVLDKMVSNCSLLGIYGDSIRLFYGSMHKSDNSIVFRPNHQRISVRFDADPSSRQIMATVDDKRFVLTTAMTDDEFWRLRPCAVVADAFKLLLSSDWS